MRGGVDGGNQSLPAGVYLISWGMCEQHIHNKNVPADGPGTELVLSCRLTVGGPQCALPTLLLTRRLRAHARQWRCCLSGSQTGSCVPRLACLILHQSTVREETHGKGEGASGGC